LFLPLGQGLSFLAERNRRTLALIAGGLILCLLTGLTLQRARLWQDTDRLTAYWAVSNPDSPRAQNAVAAILANRGQIGEANAYLQAAIERLPDSALLNLRLLLQKIYARQATGRDFEIAGQRLAHQPFDAQAVTAMRAIVDYVIQAEAPAFYRDATLELLETMDRNAAFSRFSVYRRLSPYLKGRLYLAQSEPAEACRQYGQAVPLYGDVEAVLMMVAEIASAGVFDCALTTLTLAEKMFDQQRDRSLRRPRARYEIEIKRLREIIEQKRRQ
jgi:tetratricopeptide (TPR) repeat protein